VVGVRQALGDVGRSGGTGDGTGRGRAARLWPTTVRSPAAQLTSDERLREIAELSEVSVPLGHLRHLDPRTRIVVGCLLDLAGDEGLRLERSRRTPRDPGWRRCSAIM